MQPGPFPPSCTEPTRVTRVSSQFLHLYTLTGGLLLRNSVPSTLPSLTPLFVRLVRQTFGRRHHPPSIRRDTPPAKDRGTPGPHHESVVRCTTQTQSLRITFGLGAFTRPWVKKTAEVGRVQSDKKCSSLSAEDTVRPATKTDSVHNLCHTRGVVPTRTGTGRP